MWPLGAGFREVAVVFVLASTCGAALSQDAGGERSVPISSEGSLRSLLHALAVATGGPIHFEYPVSSIDTFPQRYALASINGILEDLFSELAAQLPNYTWEIVSDSGRRAGILFPRDAAALGTVVSPEWMAAPITVESLVRAMDGSVELASLSANPVLPYLVTSGASVRPWQSQGVDLRDVGAVSLRHALAILLLRVSSAPIVYYAHVAPTRPARHVDVMTNRGRVRVPVETAPRVVLLELFEQPLIEEAPRIVPADTRDIAVIAWPVEPRIYASPGDLLQTRVNLQVHGSADLVSECLMRQLRVGICLEAPQSGRPLWNPRVELLAEEVPFSEVLDAFVGALGPGYMWRLVEHEGRYAVCCFPVSEETQLDSEIAGGGEERLSVRGLLRAREHLFLEGDEDSPRSAVHSGPCPQVAQIENVVERTGRVPLREAVAELLIRGSSDQVMYYRAYWSMNQASAEAFMNSLVNWMSPDPAEDTAGAMSLVDQWVAVRGLTRSATDIGAR